MPLPPPPAAALMRSGYPISSPSATTSSAEPTGSVVPGMIAAGRGSIVNFGSLSWMVLLGNLPAYTAAKAAMHGMSRSLARDLGPHGIRVNTLVPGWVMTEKQLTTIVGEAEGKMIDANQALKARVYPADIARMALFLAADDSQMISAQDFIVDGGWAH